MDFQEDKNNEVHLENFSCVKTIILTLTLIPLKLLHVPQSNQDAGQAATADFPRNIPKQQSCLYTDESIQYHHAVSSVGITFLSLEYKHTTTTSLSKHLLLNFRSRSKPDPAIPRLQCHSKTGCLLHRLPEPHPERPAISTSKITISVKRQLDSSDLIASELPLVTSPEQMNTGAKPCSALRSQ